MALLLNRPKLELTYVPEHWAANTDVPFGAFNPDAFKPATEAELSDAQMAMLSPEWFYANRYLGLRFNAEYWLDGRKHISFGLDVEHGTHVAIPAPHDGRIVRRDYSPLIGNCITAEMEGIYITWCHTTERRHVGDHIHKGERVANIAGHDDPHGSAWTGPHVAVHAGHSTASWYGYGAIDPLKYVQR